MRKVLAVILAVAALVAALGGPVSSARAQGFDPDLYTVGDVFQTIVLTHNGDPNTNSNTSNYYYTPPTGFDLVGWIIDYQRSTPNATLATILGTGGEYGGSRLYDNTPSQTSCFVDDDYFNDHQAAYDYCANSGGVDFIGSYMELEASNNYLRFGSWGDLGYSTSTTITIYPILYGQAEPTINACLNQTMYRTYDLLTAGTLTAGSYEVQKVNFELSTLDFTTTLSLPTETLTGLKGGYLLAEIDYAIPGDVTMEVNINGMPSTIQNVDVLSLELVQDPPDVSKVLIPGEVTDLTITVSAEITGALADLGSGQTASVIGLKLKIPLADACRYNLLNDGGMELTDFPNPYWVGEPGYAEWSRIFSTDWLGSLLNGGPACQTGYQIVGSGFPSGDPIYQPFTWSGGTAYWKARYRTFSFFGTDQPTPHMYLVGNGAVYDLIGNGTPDEELRTTDWTLMTGSLSLPAGEYGVYMSEAFAWDGDVRNYSGGIRWDDVAIGEIPQSAECDEIDVEIPPDQPTPTPSPTGPTNTPTITRTATQGPSLTATRTTRPSYTPPASTSTARPTVTRTATRTPNSATLTAPVPTVTKTPFGLTTPIGTPSGPTITPGGPTVTPGGETTPVVGDWRDPGGWTGNPAGDCARPTGWEMLNVNRWIDYEMCSAMSFVTWGPSQQSTLQAIPSRFDEYEPFGTINELSDGYTLMRTQVASYPWYNTGVDGVNDGVSPLTFLRAPGQPDAWAVNAKPFDFSPGSSQSNSVVEGENYFVAGGEYADVSGTSANQNALVAASDDPNITTGASSNFEGEIIGPGRSYAAYCNMQLSSLFSGNLARGACYALGFARTVGLLPWVQFFINIASIVSIIRAFLAFIGMAVPTAVVVSDTASEADAPVENRWRQKA